MARSHRISHWNPEDIGPWEAGEKAIARRNLLWIVACDHIAFGVWTLWLPLGVLLRPGRSKELSRSLLFSGQQHVFPSHDAVHQVFVREFDELGV